jgi:predicted DNA repair protein MutK
VLAAVGLGITFAVYGVVAIIVKTDDFGLALVRNSLSASGFRRPVGAFGRGLVFGVPVFLSLLAAIGTAAMLWVGGNILVHGLELHGLAAPAHAIAHVAEFAAHAIPTFPGVASWLASAALAGTIGLAVGAVSIPLKGKVLVPAYRWTLHGI